MNDEIKEILELFESTDNNIMFGDIVELNSKQSHLLLDYIINLQQINNNQAKRNLRQRLANQKQQELILKLQRENERLKMQCKEWKENHKAVCIQRDNILDNIVKDTEEKIDYKSRCEKAYEELTYMSSSDYVEDYDIKQNCWIKLSNILQNGGNND